MNRETLQRANSLNMKIHDLTERLNCIKPSKNVLFYTEINWQSDDGAYTDGIIPADNTDKLYREETIQEIKKAESEFIKKINTIYKKEIEFVEKAFKDLGEK